MPYAILIVAVCLVLFMVAFVLFAKKEADKLSKK